MHLEWFYDLGILAAIKGVIGLLENMPGPLSLRKLGFEPGSPKEQLFTR